MITPNNIQKNTWATLASLTLIVGGIGHFILIDLCTIIFETSIANWFPSPILNELKKTTLDIGVLGNNNAFRIFSGFSLWMAFSLVLFGIFNLLIFRQIEPGHKLRVHALALNLFISIVFLVLASSSFIWPAAVGGAAAVVFFALALRKEKKYV